MYHLSITVQIKLSKYRNKTQFKSKNPFKTLLTVIKLMIMATTNRFNNLSKIAIQQKKFKQKITISKSIKKKNVRNSLI